MTKVRSLGLSSPPQNENTCKSLSLGVYVDHPALISGVQKLATLGNQAGFSTEELIRILNGGFTVEELLELIRYRIKKQRRHD